MTSVSLVAKVMQKVL